MAVPKKRTSKMKKRLRKTNWKVQANKEALKALSKAKILMKTLLTEKTPMTENAPVTKKGFSK